MSVILECCQKQRDHHNAVFEKYAQKQYKKASIYVEGELAKGFELPAVKRESSLGVGGYAAAAVAAVNPAPLLWRTQTQSQK
jgi:hypothetical protein